MYILRILLGVFFVVLLLFPAGCESLKSSRPIIPIREYERLLVGRLDANYVGTRNCLSACHYHDKIRRDFEASTMGAQLSSKSGMPIVDCESCHGPGSLAIEGITPEKVKLDEMEGKRTACKFDTLIDIKNLPPQASSLICLKCHTANATFNLHDWNTGGHAGNDVVCSDCHNIHAGPDLIVRPRETFKICFRCHQETDAQFSMPSHHPIHEERVVCTDCHDPHGTPYDKLLREDTIKATCTNCHAEKEGPFIYEHADVNEDCRTCHSPHGSINNNLLIMQEPFLCLQCHSGHRTDAGTAKEIKGAFYTRCSDCHSQVHGTDIPSASGTGRFIR